MGIWASSSAMCTHVCMGTAKGQLCCAHRGSLGSWLGLDKRLNLLDMDEPALCQPHHPRALRVPWVLLQLNLLCTEVGLNSRSFISLPPEPPLPGHVSSWCGGGTGRVMGSFVSMCKNPLSQGRCQAAAVWEGLCWECLCVVPEEQR